MVRLAPRSGRTRNAIAAFAHRGPAKGRSPPRAFGAEPIDRTGLHEELRQAADRLAALAARRRLQPSDPPSNVFLDEA